MDVTDSDLKEWWQLDATQKVLQKFREQRQDVLEKLGYGFSLDNDAGLTAQQTARAVGEVAGLDYFIEKQFIDDD